MIKEFTDKGYGVSIYRVQGTPVCHSNYTGEIGAKYAAYGFVELYIVEEIT